MNAMKADGTALPRLSSAPAGVRALLEAGRYAEAEQAAQELLGADPDSRDGLYMLAVAQRYQGHIREALATLERLEKAHSEYPRLYQEKGYCQVALRSAASAIEAFERAVTLNPTLLASWKALQSLYNMTSRAAEAENAGAHVGKLTKLPIAVVTARSMFLDGEIEPAEALIRQHLQSHADDVEGMRVLAQIGMKLDVLDDAEFLLETVLRIAPDYRAARHDYAQVLQDRHKHRKAREQVAILRRTDPDDRASRMLEASISTGMGECDHALSVYQELLRDTPEHPELLLCIGHTLKTLGHQEEAIEAYRKSATARRTYGEAYWSLANLKTYRFLDQELDQMRSAEAAPHVALTDRFHLCFALGKALEDRGQYAESFAYYERGNALKKAQCRYRPDPIERNTQLQSEICTPGFFAARRGFGSRRRGPIFIVGLPRAGSTLIEQILASHSQVEGTMELADVPRLVQQLRGREDLSRQSRYPAVLAELSAEDCRHFGEQYLTDTLLYRSDRPCFIDKMPNNFRHIGLIHLMLPEAKIIDARREAMACCFGNFKQLFAHGQEFTYSLEDIARYYRTYVDLMAHWDRVLPGRVLRVQHEQLVTDFERQVRRILEFCDLDFEPGCLHFYKTERRVHTASSEQVRRPISAQGLEQWRHYERWLGSLRAALGPCVDNRAE